ncbi:MAG TPA: glycoside hydrolase family 16 protein [Streptosporangiaceae bacterium]|nr:glycoside hydrolase family 16 protein [Streptosporangiaceae bacterium]
MIATVVATTVPPFSGVDVSSAAVSPRSAGWTLVWGDNFDGPAGSGVNRTNWIYDLGHGYPGGPANWGTGEVESMTGSTRNVRLDGAGHLAITPIRDAAGNWTSGRIETRRTDFAAPPGGTLRVEGRLQQPRVSGAGAAGYWPAFWMMGDAVRRGDGADWPSMGEIDIMENVNGRGSVFAALHCGEPVGGPCNETTGFVSGERPCPGCQTGFHTFTMEYDRSVSPEQLRWYLDGANFFTVNAAQMDATTWKNATHHGFFIIINVAMGGGLPAAFGGGPTAATVSGVPMLVDYVAVSTRPGRSTAPP